MVPKELVVDLAILYHTIVSRWISLWLSLRMLEIDASLCSQKKNLLLEGQDFANLFQLARKMSAYELLLKDKNRGSHEEFIQNLALIGRYESEDEYDQDENIKIGVAKVELNKPYVC